MYSDMIDTCVKDIQVGNEYVYANSYDDNTIDSFEEEEKTDSKTLARCRNI